MAKMCLSNWLRNKCFIVDTVNSENFARVLFSRNFAYHMRSFVKIKSSRNGEITLPFTDIGKPCPSRDFYVANMPFNAIRENEILAKISELTV